MTNIKYYVYVIKDGGGSLYTGMTKNLWKRIWEHNKGMSRYTSSRILWKLVWYCVFFDEVSAEGFERYLKTGSGRVFIKKRILRNPP